MFDRLNAWQIVKMAAVAGATAVTMSACISDETTSNTAQVTPQGTIDLEKIRSGMPEEVFRKARVTFAVDTKPEAQKGGKTQYLSRTYNSKNGQYIAQCKDDRCVVLQVSYNPPVEKAFAIASLPTLMPADDGAETFVDDSVLQNQKTPMATEFHYFGNKGLVMVNYADKSGTAVSSIYAYALPPERALTVAFGKVPAALKVPAESKMEAVADNGAPADKKAH